jgi:hypothetical protein
MSRQGKIGLTPATGFDIKTISFGAVAQLGERLNGIQEVVSSILISSTKKIKDLGNCLSPFLCLKDAMP